jgi:hypothetical protein
MRLCSWKLLPAVAAFGLVLTAAAAQQEKPEWQRRLDALKLPVDPKYTALLEKANASVNRCFDDAATKALAIPARSDQQITDAACNACDRQIADYSRVYVQANQHRYIGLTVEEATKSQGDYCKMMNSLRVSELREKYQDEVTQRTTYGAFDTWKVEGRLHRDGRLSYALIGQADTAVSIEIRCVPVNKNVYGVITGTFKKTKDREETYVTYIIDAGGLKQTRGYISDASISVPDRDGQEGIWSIAQKATGTLKLSIQGQTAAFQMSGYKPAFLKMVSLCLG